MAVYGEWEPINDPLGQGGQSVVYLARRPARIAERKASAATVKQFSSLSINQIADAETFAKALLDLARKDHPTELGALKVFKIRPGGAPAQERLKREIAVLGEGRPNLPKLLDANEKDQWLVTEYFPHGTLFDSPTKYRGAAVAALKAFRTLVATVATSLHRDGIVHRDIKPANVFIGPEDVLIPGDFGIVYLPHDPARITVLNERVGPSDYMPPWADSLGDDLDEIEPNFDVYMLGKLLWCMVAGRLKLRREYYREPEFDLAKAFPENADQMNFVNSILDKCLVDRPARCLPSAKELLEITEEKLDLLEQGTPGRDLNGKLVLRCQMCGKGRYLESAATFHVNHDTFTASNVREGVIKLRAFACNVCTHTVYFAPNFPEEAATKGWKPWRQND